MNTSQYHYLVVSRPIGQAIIAALITKIGEAATDLPYESAAEQITLYATLYPYHFELVDVTTEELAAMRLALVDHSDAATLSAFDKEAAA